MVPIHPMLVHAPLALVLTAPVLGIWFAVRRAEADRSFGVIVIVWQVLLCVLVYAATVTGENEEKTAGKVVAKELITEHEYAGNFLLLASVLCIPAAAFAVRRKERWASIVLVVFQLWALSIAIRTGYLGGALVYKHGAAGAYHTDADGREQKAR